MKNISVGPEKIVRFFSSDTDKVIPSLYATGELTGAIDRRRARCIIHDRKGVGKSYLLRSRCHRQHCRQVEHSLQ